MLASLYYTPCRRSTDQPSLYCLPAKAGYIYLTRLSIVWERRLHTFISRVWKWNPASLWITKKCFYIMTLYYCPLLGIRLDILARNRKTWLTDDILSRSLVGIRYQVSSQMLTWQPAAPLSQFCVKAQEGAGHWIRVMGALFGNSMCNDWFKCSTSSTGREFRWRSLYSPRNSLLKSIQRKGRDWKTTDSFSSSCVSVSTSDVSSLTMLKLGRLRTIQRINFTVRVLCTIILLGRPRFVTDETWQEGPIMKPLDAQRRTRK